MYSPIETIRVDGITIRVPDVDILVYFFRDTFKPKIKALAQAMEHDDPGPPTSEREKLIIALDKEIESLEHEKEKLYKQVNDSGLVIKEEYVVDSHI